MGKPNDLPIAKKHKSMDSDEDDEEPQNEPGTSSTSQPFLPVLPLNQGPAASSQGPAASSNSDDENSEYSARSQDSGRTVLCPDLYILTNDEHWTVTPETHKFAAAAGILFSDYGDRRTTGYKQFDYYAKCAAMTVPQGGDRQFPNQRHAGTLYGHLWTSRRSKSPKCGLVHERKEASAQKVRENFKQFAGVKHIEWKSWIDNEGF